MSEQFKSIETTELVKIANAIRTKTGTTDKISLEDMPAKIAAIEGGTALPELENEGAASDLLSGKELIDDEGNVVTGTFSIDNELTTQDDLIAQIQTALQNKAAGGSAEPVLQEKTVSPSTSKQTVTPDSNYDGLSKVTVNAMTTATQATPSITINSSGLITASSTQTAGYVAAGTKSATKQLTTQAAKTVTPSTSNQTAVASGVYTTGAVSVAGDANLVAGNIKSGVSIFGVSGSYEGSGGSGGGTDIKIATGSITNDTVQFYRDTELFSVSGLGFKPKTLVVHSSMDTSSTLSTTYTYRFSSYYMNDAGEFRCAYFARGNATSAGSVYLYNTTNSSIFTVTVNDDGFTVKSGPSAASNYKFYIPKNIYYIAIG